MLSGARERVHWKQMGSLSSLLNIHKLFKLHRFYLNLTLIWKHLSKTWLEKCDIQHNYFESWNVYQKFKWSLWSSQQGNICTLLSCILIHSSYSEAISKSSQTSEKLWWSFSRKLLTVERCCFCKKLLRRCLPGIWIHLYHWWVFSG